MSSNRPGLLPRLHFITDTRCQDRFTHQELTQAFLKGGGTLIQYRDKYEESTRQRLQLARELQALCLEHRASLIINDRADIAACTQASGLHLGPTDLSITDARTIVGPTPIIGATINEPDHARALVANPPDYVGIGPFRATSNKEAATYSLGLQGMKELLDETQAILGRTVPAVAIGGIGLEDVAPLIKLGFHGVAVIGAIAKASSPERTTQAFISAIESAVKER